jgi:hypothetical protein
MYSTKKRWKSNEDEVIINFVKRYPNNLSYSFELASKELRYRTITSIANRYYNGIRKKDTYLAIASENGIVLNNVKNSPRKRNNDNIDMLLNIISKLPDETKQFIVEKILFNN